MQRSRASERLRAKPVGDPKRSETKNGGASKARCPDRAVAPALVELHSATDPEGVFSALRRVLREEVRFSFVVFLLRSLKNDRETLLRVAGHSSRSEAELGAIVTRADEIRRQRKQKLIRLPDPREEERLAVLKRQHRTGTRPRAVPAVVLGFEGCGYAQATLLVGRARGDDDFESAELDALSRLQPHVTTALRCVRTLQRERITCLALQKLLSRFPVGIVLLDWEERALYRNAAATELCALWNYGEDGRSLNATRVFRVPKDVVRACRSLENAHEREVSVLSPEEPHVRAVVQSVRFEAQLLGRPRYLVHFEAVSGKRGAHAGPNRIDLLLRLTPRERELADVVGRGISNADAARRLGKSVYTVKKQLQGVYRKLGVKSRARLVAILSR